MKITVEMQKKRHFIFGDLEAGEIFQPVCTTDLYVCCKLEGRAAFAAVALNSATYAAGTIRYFTQGAQVLRAISMTVKLENTAP